jgi:hypothetical protein
MRSKIKWSILIPSLLYRKSNFNYIYKILYQQIKKEGLSDYIEILDFLDDGENNFLDKKKFLIEKSKGKYISFLYDDLEISDNFIKDIFNNLNGNYLYFDQYFINNGKYQKESFPDITLYPISRNKIDEDYFYGKVKIDSNSLEEVFTVRDRQRKNPYSIIVTAYKSQDFIEECLDSIEGQSYFKDYDEFEVLVGVDGCESTLNKLKDIRYKYRNLKIFMMDSNMGTYVTSNTLIDLVKYENIIRFDSDDIMMSFLVQSVDNNIHRYSVIKLGYHNFINDTNKIQTQSDTAHGVLYFKKQIMDNLAGGYENWACAADSEFIFRIRQHVNILDLEEPVFFYRIHSGSLTRRTDTGMKSDIRKKYRSMIKPNYLISDLFIKRITAMYEEV